MCTLLMLNKSHSTVLIFYVSLHKCKFIERISILIYLYLNWISISDINSQWQSSVRLTAAILAIPSTDWPHIEWNGHHCVKDDDVGPEGQETGQGGVSVTLPREEGCKRSALLMFPNRVPNSQTGAHEPQETENLDDRRTDHNKNPPSQQTFFWFS